MEYKYPPIYKYLTLILIFFMFLRHYKVVTHEQYLPITIIFVLTVGMLDYVLIHEHPYLTSDANDDNDEIDEIIKSNQPDKSDKKSDKQKANVDEDVEISEDDILDTDVEKSPRVTAMAKKMAQKMAYDKQLMQQQKLQKMQQMYQQYNVDPYNVEELTTHPY
jgi:hypothetical protein